MNFFQQLSATGDVDITLRIMGKNGKLTINIMPGSTKSHAQPLILTGTAEVMDDQFFQTILPQANEVKELISNIDEVKKSAEKKKEEAEKKAEKKTSSTPPQKSKGKGKTKNKPEKKAVKKKEEASAPVEGSLFDAPAEETTPAEEVTAS